MSDKESAEQRIVAPNDGAASGSLYRSIGDQAPAAPKPAVRQRTTTTTTTARQNNKNANGNSIQNNHQQDLCDGQSRKSLVATRDELNRELQAELGRKLSLARSRLEQSEQLKRQVEASSTNNNNDDDNHSHRQQQLASKSADLSLSMCRMEEQRRPDKSNSNSNNSDQQVAPKISDQLPPTRAYPKKVFFIIANEFCERFSYYGLRTVLVMYLTRVLNFSESNSTITFHLFAMLCYVTPIIGAILGDSILGKFKTILYLSVVYLLGELILMMSSIFWNYGPGTQWSTFVGLFLIGFGTGGIKPCVSALGGDQFMAHEEKWRQSFFSIFYAAINFGSVLSVFVTPLLRTEFHCVGRQDCFPYAFGLPSILMFLSIVVFLLAKNQYYLAPLPDQNVIVSFCKCIWVASKRKLTRKRPLFVLDDNLEAIVGGGGGGGKRLSSQDEEEGSSSSLNVSETSSNETISQLTSAQSSSTHLAPAGGDGDGGAAIQDKDNKTKKKKKMTNRLDHVAQRLEDSRRRSHWLYLAADHFDSKSIEAFRSVLSILLLFVPTLVYWCLFDQQGSLWTLQATRMDGHIFGPNRQFVLQPDQMGVANPLILLAMIPIFELYIYPCFGRCRLMKKPLQRMTVGGFLASLAFLSSAAIELRIKQFLPPNVPHLGSANLILVNGLRECSLIDPTISHMPPPDVLMSQSAGAGANQPPLPELLAGTSPALIGASNQSVTDHNEPSQASGPQQNSGWLTSIRLNSLEALAVSESVEIKSSSSSSALSSYQLKLRLADSLEQIRSNRSFGCPIAAATATSSSNLVAHEFSFAPLPDRAARLLYLELGNGKLTYKLFNESLELPPSNRARVRLLYEFFGSASQAERRQFSLASSTGESAPNKTDAAGQRAKKTMTTSFVTSLKDGQVLLSDYLDIGVPSSGAAFSLESNDNKLVWSTGASVLLEPGTRNLLIVHQSDANHVWLKQQVLQDNKYRINMLYQLIPYTLISMSEVMFSITGLEFSYSMAPASMKSVLLAIWSLTIAFGNLLTVFVESLHMFSDVAYEFMFYAGLMAVDMCIFAIMGHNFRPNKYHGNQ